MKRDIAIPSELFYDTRLGFTERLVLIVLYSFSSPSTGVARPSLKGIAMRSGLRSVTAVKKSLQQLASHNWIEIKAAKGKPNHYLLLTPPLSSLPKDEVRVSKQSTKSTKSTKSINYYLAKSTKPYTHTQQHAERAERAEQAERESSPGSQKGKYGSGKEDSEQVQFDKDKAEGNVSGTSGSLGIHTYTALAEILGGRDPSRVRSDTDDHQPFPNAVNAGRADA